MIRTLLLLVLFEFGTRPLHAQASSCRPVDTESQRFLSDLRSLVTSTDPNRVDVRNALGLQTTAAANVTTVLDKKTCDKMVLGLNNRLNTNGLARQLYVVKVGNNFAAKDPAHPAGEWIPVVTFDKNGKFKAVVLTL